MRTSLFFRGAQNSSHMRNDSQIVWRRTRTPGASAMCKPLALPCVRSRGDQTRSEQHRCVHSRTRKVLVSSPPKAWSWGGLELGGSGAGGVGLRGKVSLVRLKILPEASNEADLEEKHKTE